MSAESWASRAAAVERGLGPKYRYRPAAIASGRLAGVCFSCHPSAGAEAACGDLCGVLGCTGPAGGLAAAAFAARWIGALCRKYSLRLRCMGDIRSHR